MQEKQKQKSSADIITKAFGGRNGENIIDFRDGLIPTRTEHYARIHESGGEAGVIPSRIKLYLSKKGAFTLHVNLEPEVLFVWYEICKRNLGQTVIPLIETEGSGRNAVTKPSVICDVFQSILATGINAHSANLYLKNLTYALAALSESRLGVLAKLVSGVTLPNDPECLKQEGVSLKRVRKGMVLRTVGQKEQMIAEPAVSVNTRVDYEKIITKFPGQRVNPNTFVKGTNLTIRHQCIKPGADPALSSYPWYIGLQEFEAKPSGRGQGYDMKSMRNQRQLYINLGEEDMFRMMRAVTRYIELWEIAYGVPTLKNGRAMLEQERKNRNQENNFRRN